MYIFSDGCVVLCAHQCWINTEDLAPVFAYTSICICILFLTDRLGQTAITSLSLTVLVRALTFAAAVKVTSEHWVLLDLDLGCVKPLSVISEQKGMEDRREWGRV